MKKTFLPFVSADTQVNIVKHDIQIEKVLIDPAFACELLKGNQCNRALTKSKILKYAEDMKNGLWTADTAETIKLTHSMRVLDGQHRLHGIVLANVSVEMFIAYNVPESAMNNIDTGMSRSTKNIFELNGIPYAQQVSATIKKYLAYKMHPNLPDNDPVRKGGATNKMVLDEYNKNPDMWQSLITKIMKCKTIFKNIEPSYLGAWYALCKDINEEDTVRYFDTLMSGIGFTNVKDPIYLFREYLLKDNAKGQEHKRIMDFALFAKSWNYVRTKQVISVLRYTINETYPKLK
jgi:hypothetical protein